MSDDAKTPLEQAIELLVYAPLGLALTARDELPRIIDKGRQQVNMARMMGQFAVAQGQKEAEKVVKQATETIAGRSAGRPSSSTPSPSASPASPTATKPTATKPTATNGARTAGHSDDDLAIPGYDSLSASQVVQRLAGLSGPELEAVRTYEAATRGRKTILHRVEQLQTTSTG